MAQVFIAAQQGAEKLWCVVRICTGSAHLYRVVESMDHKTVKGAKEWAKTNGHEVVTLTRKGVLRP